MNYISRLLIILLCVCVLSGCQSGDIEIDEISKKLCDAPVTAVECFYDLDPTDFTQAHYLDEPLAVNYRMCAQDYVDSSGASTPFGQRYQQSDRVDIYPVYGTYLEPTDMALCVFYSGDQATGIGSLTISSSGSVTSSFFKDMPVRPTTVTALSLEECFLIIMDCREDHPDFHISGIIYSTEGYPAIYPIGTAPGSEQIQFVHGSPQNYDYSFTTPESGHALLTAHRERMCSLLAGITIFPWKDASCVNDGYLRRFTDPALPAPDTYDFVVAVPLLSKALEEDTYILHLFYRDYQLVSELVVKRTDAGTTGAYEIVWDRQPENGSPAVSEYIRILAQANRCREGWSAQGVIFDNGFYPIGAADQTAYIYHPDTEALREYP